MSTFLFCSLLRCGTPPDAWMLWESKSFVFLTMIASVMQNVLNVSVHPCTNGGSLDLFNKNGYERPNHYSHPPKQYLLPRPCHRWILCKVRASDFSKDSFMNFESLSQVLLDVKCLGASGLLFSQCHHHASLPMVISRGNACVSVKMTVPKCGHQIRRNNDIAGGVMSGSTPAAYQPFHVHKPVWPLSKWPWRSTRIMPIL